MRKASRKQARPTSFTLIELLAVIAIIAILCGLTLAAYNGVFKTAARDRARSEIKAISSALELYKNDNGSYPTPPGGAPNFASSNYPASSLAPDVPGPYQDSSAYLYQALTGTTNYGDAPPTPASGTKIYETFTRSQLGNDTASAGAPIYIKDPFGNSYGYNPWFVTGGASGTANMPNNGTGFFDLWSTGGDTTGTNSATWINNWNG